MNGICQSPNCQNPIPEERRKYCCDECRFPAYRARKHHQQQMLSNVVSQMITIAEEIPEMLTEIFFKLEDMETKIATTPPPQPQQLPLFADQPQPRRATTSAPPADFDIEMKRATSNENDNAAWNFKISSAAMVYGDYSHLSPEIIEYGVRTGKIPKDKAPNVTGENSPVLSGPKPLAGADIDLSQPTFEDLELTF